MMGIGQGIEKANKIMMPLFFLLFVGLAVYIALQPGAVAGYRYIFRVDPVALKSPMTWIYRPRAGVLLPLHRRQRHHHLWLLSLR